MRACSLWCVSYLDPYYMHNILGCHVSGWLTSGLLLLCWFWWWWLISGSAGSGDGGWQVGLASYGWWINVLHYWRMLFDFLWHYTVWPEINEFPSIFSSNATVNPDLNVLLFNVYICWWQASNIIYHLNEERATDVILTGCSGSWIIKSE